MSILKLWSERERFYCITVKETIFSIEEFDGCVVLDKELNEFW
jgi:hypothetical protein